MIKHPDIILDTKIYSLEAIRAAIYDMAIICNTDVTLNKDTAHICFDFFDDNTSLTQTISKFRSLANDHQLRIDINKKTYKIREIILAQAFAPCENIGEILKIQNITD